MLRITWIVLFLIPYNIHALESVELELASLETAFFTADQVNVEIIQQDHGYFDLL